jgi:hypothetical protein
MLWYIHSVKQLSIAGLAFGRELTQTFIQMGNEAPYQKVVSLGTV